MTNLQQPTNTQRPKPNAEASPRPYDIRERTFEFALRILDIASRLPGSAESDVIRKQLMAAGTSIGANVEEADGASTRADKRKSFVVSRKEARETRYWLRIIERRWPAVAGVKPEIQESGEIVNILSVIIEKLS